jgi:hypothetical protein
VTDEGIGDVERRRPPLVEETQVARDLGVAGRTDAGDQREAVVVGLLAEPIGGLVQSGVPECLCIPSKQNQGSCVYQDVTRQNVCLGEAAGEAPREGRS